MTPASVATKPPRHVAPEHEQRDRAERVVIAAQAHRVGASKRWARETAPAAPARDERVIQARFVAFTIGRGVTKSPSAIKPARPSSDRCRHVAPHRS